MRVQSFFVLLYSLELMMKGVLGESKWTSHFPKPSKLQSTRKRLLTFGGKKSSDGLVLCIILFEWWIYKFYVYTWANIIISRRNFKLPKYQIFKLKFIVDHKILLCIRNLQLSSVKKESCFWTKLSNFY